MKKTLVILVIGFVTLIRCSVDDSSEVNQFVFEVPDYFQIEQPETSNTFERLDDEFFLPRADTVAALGRVLFYDKRLSKNNSISCESCHIQRKAFCDNEQFSMGLQNGLTPRNSMSLINSIYQRRFFWEGEREQFSAASSQAFGWPIPVLNPVSNHIEMGMDDTAELVEKLSEIELYQDLFGKLYGGVINENNISQALQVFLQSIISKNSRYDEALENPNTFTYKEKLGQELFNGKALCIDCHKGDSFISTWRNTANIGLDEEYVDQGAGDGHFKVPTLRNIALTGPYMHDGRFETLEEVVNHYTDGIQEHPQLDWSLDNQDINLDSEEKEALIAFLNTLTDYSLLTDDRFSNPFR
jgi:cytochrome c peroxidase